MPKFSQKSLERLATCCQPLQDLFNEVIKTHDCTILEGHRGQEAQDKAYREGRSQLKWPNGKHNKSPSLAVDVMAYPIDWQNINRILEFAAFVKETATRLNIIVEYGGDWPKFKDYPHWQLPN